MAAPLRNRAGDSRSPYVQALASSPVMWQLLDSEAVDRARAENKPIFMNIGFRACHYCRLTIHESFSHPAVAAILNKSFVPIVVDREERPDVDAVYWNYIQTLNSNAGWPIHVFLTPDLEPVFGGTYWPAPGSASNASGGRVSEEEGTLDFLGILKKLQQSWEDREAQCRAEAKDTVVKLQKFAAEGTLGARRRAAKPAATTTTTTTTTSSAGESAATGAAAAAGTADPKPSIASDLELDLDQLEEAYTQLAGTFDSAHGGFGFLPKFITPAKFSFLLRLARFPAAVRDVVGDKEVAQATQMALHTLRRIRDGAVRDHVGAGFARYSITEDWTLPTFEKMVADNAHLLSLFLDAWLSAADEDGRQPARDGEFADVVLELADYLTSAPVLNPDGSFATSEAADSFYRRGDREMREGAYYMWTRREFDAVVGQPGRGESATDGETASAVAAAHWNVLEHGNVEQEFDPDDEFINQNVLYMVKDAAELGRQFGLSPAEVRAVLASARRKLRAHRERERVRPDVDAKVVTAYNGMVIAALARAGAALARTGVDKSAGERYIQAAAAAARFLRDNLWDAEGAVLYRMYHGGGRADTRGFADDYAFLIDGLLELYEATGEAEWLQWADQLQKNQISLFYDHPAPASSTAGSRPSTAAGQESSSSSSSATHSASGAFYSTPDPAQAPHVILRLKDGMDTTQPSTNAVSASNLFRLGGLLGDGDDGDDGEYTRLAVETVHAFEVEMLQHPWLFPGLLSGVVSARLGGRRFALCGGGDGAEGGELVARYFALPRGGLRSLLTLGGDKEKQKQGEWLEERSTGLGELLGGERKGLFVFEDGKWRKATAKDFEEV
ncbi:uncharacterized protein E0L32_007951 [Thyridium curvatum]|uniref:Spermatogenesis-associated protein 20-like TRX domain-containing protein n=1 Tax=Thyridium curvatum TaxID=1093900 RepID=A0A507B3C6_9PEZI|nr:uncharacterized protein E0L32_007951 [Thyridium curvatum]TPX11090.1 hypothetical protein E0L32_007951 [Thyridium curvatum]